MSKQVMSATTRSIRSEPSVMASCAQLPLPAWRLSGPYGQIRINDLNGTVPGEGLEDTLSRDSSRRSVVHGDGEARRRRADLGLVRSNVTPTRRVTRFQDSATSRASDVDNPARHLGFRIVPGDQTDTITRPCDGFAITPAIGREWPPTNDRSADPPAP
jgi:hypothetical protein